MSALSLVRLIFLTGLTSFALAADPEDFNRLVRIDWEPIESAVRYEFERFRDSDCTRSEGITRTQSPVWENRLPAGNYCVRVRGVSADDRLGQWSEPQKVEVRPKPPRDIVRDGNLVRWDRIPYASEYEVRVLDDSGAELFRGKSARNELSLPESLLSRPGLRPEKLRVAVRTLVQGVSPSTDHLEPFVPAGSPRVSAEPGRIGGSNTAEAGQGAAIRLRVFAQRFPAQKPLMAPTPEEAVQRYRDFGEKPIPPTAEEWSLAQAPEQKESLRRRAIASQRVELLEKFDRQHPPDLTFSLGVLGGNYQYRSEATGSGTPTADRFGQNFQLGVEYNRNRAWGAYFLLNRHAVSAGSESATTQFGIGGEYHWMMDSASRSVLTLGLGLGYLRVPLSLEFSGPIQFSYPIAVVGADLKLQHELRLSEKVTWTNRAGYFYSPSQGNLSDVLPEVSGTSLRVSSGFSYALSRQLELGFGAFLMKVAAQSPGAGVRATHDQSGAFVQGAYRVNPREYRRLASEDAREAWTFSAWAPAAFRSAIVRSNAGTVVSVARSIYPYNTGASAVGVEFDLARRLSPESSWSVDAHVGISSVSSEGQILSENDLRLRAGYETPFLGSKTTRIRLGLGGFSRQVLGVASSAPVHFKTWGTLLSGELRRSWTSKWNSAALLQAGLPLSVSGGVAPFNADPTAGSDGANYFWSVGFSSGYGFSEAFWLLAALDYEQQRYGMVGAGSVSASSMAIDSEEGRIRLGLQLRW